MRLIDADALKEEVNKNKVVGRFNTLNLIDNAPTIDAIPYSVHEKAMDKTINELFEVQEELNKIRNGTGGQKGEWIVIKSPLSNETIVKCLFCKDEFIGNDVENYNFCPNCGAEMQPKTHIKPKDDDDTWREDMQRDADDYLASQGGDD